MLTDWTTHEVYQAKYIKELSILNIDDGARVKNLEGLLSKLYLMNLDNLHPIIEPLYSDTGCPAKNQQGILRSLVAMLESNEHSITNWAKKVASDKILCAACGFTFGEAPGHSSYYDLINRLWQADHEKHIINKKKLKFFSAKPRKKLRSGEKLPPKHAGSVARLVDWAIDGKLPEYRPEEVFQEFLARCIVDESIKMGLLGDVNDFSIALDGSCVNSGACHYGVKVCDCPSKGIYNCKCPRRYSDPDARWGWDSYHEQYFFGNTLFSITASDSPNDLPIYLRNVQAQRHDSITAIFALNEVRKLYDNINFKSFIADGAMDNYPTYKLLNTWNITPYIPLDAKSHPDLDHLFPGIICFDDHDNPICPGGIPYINVGYSHPKGIKFRCWFAYKCIQAPCTCTNSTYGRTVYINPDFDLRIFPKVLRNTIAFKEKFKTRTSVERSNKRILVDYNIEAGNCRSSCHRFARATFATVNIHLDAWLKHLNFSILTLIERNFNNCFALSA